MAFTWDTFLQPVGTGDRNLKVLDTEGLLVYTINPYSIINASARGNLLNIGLKAGKKINIPFSSLNEAQLALPRLKTTCELLKTLRPVLIDERTKNYVESSSGNRFFSGATPSQVGLIEGSLWYNPYDRELLVWAKDIDDNLGWQKSANTEGIPEFFYQSTSPTGTGTSDITLGSFWFDTTDGTLYIYVQDEITEDFTWVSTSSQGGNQFFYQDTTPTGSGTNQISVGSFWYDTTDGILYVYVKDTATDAYFWVTASASFSVGNLFRFFYQDTQPDGTGTGEIPLGSLWYDTEDGTLFVYVADQNSSDFLWVTSYGSMGPQGPTGATGSSTGVILEISQASGFYQLQLSDVGSLIEVTASATVSIPENSVVGFATGSQISFIRTSASEVEFQPSGTVLNSINSANKISQQWGVANLIYRGSDIWYLWGDIGL